MKKFEILSNPRDLRVVFNRNVREGLRKERKVFARKDARSQVIRLSFVILRNEGSHK